MGAGVTTSAHTAVGPRIRLEEPAGQREFDGALTLGGAGAQVVVPDASAGAAIRIESRGPTWNVSIVGEAAARLDGQPLAGVRDLRRGDVMTVGAAHIEVAALARGQLQLVVHHLVGNATIAPAGMLLEAPAAGSDQLDITPIVAPREPPGTRAPRAEDAAPRRWSRRLIWMGAGAAVIATAVFISFFQPVELDLKPTDAKVRAADSWLAVHSGTRLYVLPGAHTLRAEREGYLPARADVEVARDTPAGVRLHLAALPGRLIIDTHGISAAVSIDGVPAGHAPGTIEVPAGRRTITLRAPHYLDAVAERIIAGAGRRESLTVSLQPAWGSLAIAANPAGALLSIDGTERGRVPTILQVDAGVRRIRLSAPGLKSWESSVVIESGRTLRVGTITLGQPDAELIVRSEPAGAELSIARTYRGRTPVTLTVPSGIEHEVVLDLPGYESWTRTVLAQPGGKLALDVPLRAILVPVTIEGEPAGADLYIDGKSAGVAPRTEQLLAVTHRIELRKPGYIPFITDVSPLAPIARTVRYHLISSDRATALAESAPTLTTHNGYVLHIVPPGTFLMGSAPREQGRRPNESRHPVTLARPFYMGLTEITNAQFHAFHPEHNSGFLREQARSFDLDSQPVTRVSWNETAEFCNWLSKLDGLPPAYQKRDDDYVLIRPVTAGYRLPTEAEWEYAARYAGPDRMLRYAWGDELPITAAAGNVAGTEAASLLSGTLPGYHDEFPALAPVGKFAANALGLYDMTGNVSEWVNDYYLSYIDDVPATDPLGPTSGKRHVIRGANWQSASIAELRLSWREGADAASQTLGFRIARYAE
ncbi:MAG TPA: SUMF1/EgtB/PvdO family nonheme iron enzyme [Steroidobacteraceae bacterium]|nr:SUMF1/EgtB/PvdO family nonheme iron enzyme [Steroidobacteraceae bacterium]